MKIHILLVWDDQRIGNGRAVGAFSSFEKAKAYAQLCEYKEWTVLQTTLDS